MIEQLTKMISLGKSLAQCCSLASLLLGLFFGSGSLLLRGSLFLRSSLLHWSGLFLGGSLLGSGFGGGGGDFLHLDFLLLVDLFFLGVESLSFLDVLREHLIVLHLELLLGLEGVESGSLDELLSSDSSLSDESLDLGSLVEGLVLPFDLSLDDILPDIVLLSEGEHLSDVVGSLGSESSGSLAVGKTFDFCLSLLDNLEGNDSKIWAADATSD
jgi:hypothetical protein